MAAAVAHPLPDALDDEARLVDLVVGRVQVDRLALAAVGPQLLAQARGVVRDHRVGGVEDVGAGAIVLFQADGLRAGEILQELLHVLDLGAAPAVDGLVVVADHEHVAAVAGEHAHERVLDAVGVLEFVDQDFAEALPVVREQGRVVAQQLVRAQQDLGEIDQAGAVAALLVQRVAAQHDVGPFVSAVRRVHRLDMLRATALVLLRVDPPGDLARREARFVELELLHDALDQAQLVVAVEDLEALRQLRVLPVQAQQAMREAMEGADPEPAAAVAQQRVGAMAHLAGGLVGEGHRENAVHGHAVHLVQPGDAVREHARLAAAGAGEDEVVAGGCGDRLALGGIEVV